MQNKSDQDNVILFPKWKTLLEEESLQALKEKRYEEALSKLNKLLSYQVNSYEIVIGKLISLMELGRYGEAQDICEELLQHRHKDESYYHYVHIYLTLLFQTSQYELLMEQVVYEYENNAIPSTVKEQFQQLYDMSEKMQNDLFIEKSTAYLDELISAFYENDHREQWRLIESLRKTKSSPTNTIIKFLVNENVHPVTKTAIFHWLQDHEITHEVDIHKLGLQLRVKPVDVTDIKSHQLFKQLVLMISGLEQKDPTLFHLLHQLLYRYTYVRYPIMPRMEDVKLIAEALKITGESYLNIHTNTGEKRSEDVNRYMEEIKLCETLYLGIIEE
ncbi:tetratricopeptide repeat protein [Virgibacillus sp. NKC19-3]|uniref:tetratricopeptide repeat protein n=1 Tax=Virgibacillus saliphilus TaxID=2831674 RepID=UPI001C9A5559|nr:tetratricopeptide repeat protein [Virgibacillus sp. NKC19-3]MBY7143234.1 tetratricopeptide repeat protein [Virgibacillus sp. NKC19-3]